MEDYIIVMNVVNLRKRYYLLYLIDSRGAQTVSAEYSETERITGLHQAVLNNQATLFV